MRLVSSVANTVLGLVHYKDLSLAADQGAFRAVVDRNDPALVVNAMKAELSRNIAHRVRIKYAYTAGDDTGRATVALGLVKVTRTEIGPI